MDTANSPLPCPRPSAAWQGSAPGAVSEPLSGSRRRAFGLEHEARDVGGEARLVGPHEEVLALHVAARRLEDAEALVLVHSARSDEGLLAHYALSLDLGVLARGVVDEPPPRQELCRLGAHVLDAH